MLKHNEEIVQTKQPSIQTQKQTEHKQNSLNNTEQSNPKGQQQKQSKKNQIKELTKSFNKILVVTKNQKETHSLDNRIKTVPPNNEQQLPIIHTSTSNNVR
ncbi:Hypothetical_protein [Hexamita inflata]|uniref:Hypothetical_protein n=1 Tax=Hexamita inflata TaxID=28002 RepID=A0ABP1HJ34_9EUKA